MNPVYKNKKKHNSNKHSLVDFSCEDCERQFFLSWKNSVYGWKEIIAFDYSLSQTNLLPRGKFFSL